MYVLWKQPKFVRGLVSNTPILRHINKQWHGTFFSPDGEHGRVEQPIQDYQDIVDPEESTLQAFQAVPEDYQGQGKLLTRFIFYSPFKKLPSLLAWDWSSMPGQFARNFLGLIGLF